MKSKYLVGIFLFVFWVLATALVTAGLLSRQSSKTVAGVADSKAKNSINASTVLNAEEVAKHQTANDCWMIVNSKVYDFTSLISTHSGGSQEIINDCGRDGSVSFNTENRGRPHSSGAKSILQSYYLGDLGASVNATQASVQINNGVHGKSGEDD